MSNKHPPRSRPSEPPEADDLRLINGIGPAVEKRLNSVGIFTFAQLAALSPADVAAAVADLTGLSAERIIKQDWIGQARKLASESISSEAQEEAEAPAEPMVLPVISQVELAAPAAKVTEPVPLVVSPLDAKEAQIGPPAVAARGSVGVPDLRQIEIVPAGAHTPLNFLPSDRPFDVHLTLDLSDIKVPDDTRFSYRASIYSKNLEGHSRQAVGERSGTIEYTDKLIVSVEGIALPKGTYRLKAVVILNPMTIEPTPQSGLVASKEGDLLLIF